MIETNHTLFLLQNYWWLLISVLGGILVFMLFVQGGQSLIASADNAETRSLIINSMGRKWELTFTTLVVFGGAFFASFPLFYSTSFGGAYWLWMLILFSFVLQAVSYEYRSKKGNIYGTYTYDFFLMLNGLLGCVLLGAAVSMFFFGAEFTVAKGNLLDNGSPVISRWAPTHGFEAIFNWKNLILGVAVFFLARTQAFLYMMNSLQPVPRHFSKMKIKMFANALIFVVCFLAFMAILLTSAGYSYSVTPEGNTIIATEEYKYLHNYLDMWWASTALLIGTVSVLYAVFRSAFSKQYTKGIWFSGIGTFLVVASLFWVAGYNNTAYYPSLIDPQSSLTIRNSSSSEFTLTVMSWVSVIIPLVVAYIAYAWRSIDHKKLTSAELENSSHKY